MVMESDMGLTYFDQFISANYMTVKIKLKWKVGGGVVAYYLQTYTIVNNDAQLPWSLKGRAHPVISNCSHLLLKI